MEYEGDQSGPEVGQDAAGGQETPAAPPEPPAWLDQVERSFSNQIAALGQQLEGRLPPAGEEQGPGYGHDPELGWDSEDDRARLGPGEDDDPLADWAGGIFGGDEEGSVLGPAVAAGREAVLRDARNEADRRVAEQMAPFVEAKRQEQFAALMEEFPELATREGAEALAEQVYPAAQHFGHPELANEPSFAKLVYLAKKGEERAQGEKPSGGSKEVVLEESGGTPGEPEPDHLFQQLWAQGQKSKL